MGKKRKYILNKGDRFGKLVIIEEVINSKDTAHHYYLCQCDCGNTKVIRDRLLYDGSTQSCGCLWIDTMKEVYKKRRKDAELPIGYKQGSLTIIENKGRINGKDIFYLCQCDCGKEIIVREYCLKRGQASCTCKKLDNARKAHIEVSKEKREYPDYLVSLMQDGEERNKLENKELVYEYQALFKCSSCGRLFRRSLSSVIRGNKDRINPSIICKLCSNQTSTQEDEIYKYLSSLGLKDTDIKRNDRTIISPLELDFYIPEYKLAIEYNGSYYHSDNTKQSTYHRDKFRLCEEKGVHLISIYEIDWEENKDKLKDLIKSFICPLKTIYARECKILSISEKEAEQFYISYHIQGKCILAKINYGLFYNDELVSVMGFGSSAFHNRKSKEGDYELHRFVSKSGLCVVGGASKLLKKFEHDYQPKFLLSYSWNDWFTGKLYEILGFKFDGNVQPDYYWYLNGKSINKRKCRLKDLEIKYPELYKESFEKNARNKEDYIMLSLGAVKVHRSGSKRWIKEY